MIDASLTFDRPPVGYALTKEPKNVPFEHPPELTDPVEAVTYHLDKMNDPEAFEDIVFFVERYCMLEFLPIKNIKHCVFGMFSRLVNMLERFLEANSCI